MKLTKQHLAEIRVKRLPRKMKKQYKTTVSVFDDFFNVIAALNASNWHGENPYPDDTINFYKSS